jgi:hypothetical protein
MTKARERSRTLCLGVVERDDLIGSGDIAGDGS